MGNIHVLSGGILIVHREPCGTNTIRCLTSDVLARFNLLTERQASLISFCRNSQIYFGDALKGFPLPRASCTIVYASHVLEHLYRLDEAPRFLRECKRLLQSGGVLRLAVPDLRVYISQYEQ